MDMDMDMDMDVDVIVRWGSLRKSVTRLGQDLHKINNILPSIMSLCIDPLYGFLHVRWNPALTYLVHGQLGLTSEEVGVGSTCHSHIRSVGFTAGSTYGFVLVVEHVAIGIISKLQVLIFYYHLSSFELALKLGPGT